MRYQDCPRRLSLSIAILFLAGCGGCDSAEENPGKPNTRPFAGLSLDVAVPAVGELDQIWQKDLSEWSFQNGTEHQVHGYKSPEGQANFTDALGGLIADGEKRPEVLLIPWSAVPELNAGGSLAEIPESLKDQTQLDWLGYFSGLRNRAATLAGNPSVIPVSCPVLVCYYRQDLLEKAGLEPPETWADYQKLLEDLGDWAPGLTAVEPWDEEFRASMFLARAASVAKHSEQYSFCFRFSTGDPLIGNPGFAAALEESKTALAHMPESILGFNPADCRREILSGRAALAIGFETGQVADVTRADDIQIGIALLPGSRRVFNTAIDEWMMLDDDAVHRVSFVGFTGYVLGVSAGLDKNTENAAWELARYMATDQLPTSYPKGMLSPCRDSHIQSPTAWTGTDLTTSESEQYVTAVSQSLQTDQLVMELPLIGRARFRAALTKGITDALTTQADAQAALSAVEKDWREIINELGKENVAKSYRQCLK